MAIKVPAVFEAVDRFSQPVKRMERATQSFGTKLNAQMARANRVVDKFTPGISGAARQMASFAGAAAITGGILATVNFSVNQMKDYQRNMQSLQAITGVSNDKFKEYKSVIFEVANANKVAAKDVSKTFEIIASDIPSLLENADALGKVADAAIVLSKASGDDLATSTTALTGTLNQFNLGAEHSKRVIDAMAAGNIAGNVSVSQLAQGTDKFGAVLAGMNGSVEEAVALQEVLGKANLKGAESGTVLRNVLLKLATAKTLPPTALEDLAKFGVNVDLVQDKTIPLRERLREISKIAGDEGALKNVFGERGVTAAATLLRNLDNFDEVLEKVSGPNAAGKAMELATTKTNTLVDAFGELTSKWSNIINGSERTTGAIAGLTSIVFFLADNLETVVAIAAGYVGILAALKIATLAVKIVTSGWNIAVGISNALMGKNLLLSRGSTIALKAHVMATKVATFATKAFNLAMRMNPIGLVITAVLALGGVIYALTKDWEGWTKLVESFKAENLLKTFKVIGGTILKYVLKPFEWVLKLASKLGVGGQALSTLQAFQQSNDRFLESGGNSDTVSPVNLQATQGKAQSDRYEEITKGQLDINVNSTPGTSLDTSKLGAIPVRTRQTFNFD